MNNFVKEWGHSLIAFLTAVMLVVALAVLASVAHSTSPLTPSMQMEEYWNSYWMRIWITSANQPGVDPVKKATDETNKAKSVYAKTGAIPLGWDKAR